MLEFDDIQHILLTRAPALTGRYEFLSFPHSLQLDAAWVSRHPGQGAFRRKPCALQSMRT